MSWTQWLAPFKPEPTARPTTVSGSEGTRPGLSHRALAQDLVAAIHREVARAIG